MAVKDESINRWDAFKAMADALTFFHSLAQSASDADKALVKLAGAAIESLGKQGGSVGGFESPHLKAAAMRATTRLRDELDASGEATSKLRGGLSIFADSLELYAARKYPRAAGKAMIACQHLGYTFKH